MHPEEETGSAEEQPASNMVAPRLETVEYLSRSVWDGFNFTRMASPLRKPLLSVREKLFVNCYVRQGSVECLVIHSHTAHQGQYRFFVGHGCPHAGNPAEVAVKPFDPVCDVYHRLNLRCIVEVCHVLLVVDVIYSIIKAPSL